MGQYIRKVGAVIKRGFGLFAVGVVGISTFVIPGKDAKAGLEVDPTVDDRVERLRAAYEARLEAVEQEDITLRSEGDAQAWTDWVNWGRWNNWNNWVNWGNGWTNWLNW